MLKRRSIVSGLLATAAMAAARPVYAGIAAPRSDRIIGFRNLHTGERFLSSYWRDGSYLPEPLQQISKVLRDHRDNSAYPMEPALLDLLHRLAARLERPAEFEVISGYRSPRTNAQLAARSNGVAVESLHTRGMAIDIRMQGVELSQLRDAARSLKGGGVGYYPRSGFVHVDVGRVRFW